MPNSSTDFDGLRSALLEEGGWPKPYMFKFITPNAPAAVAAVEGALPPGGTLRKRPSSNGRYMSVTKICIMPSADAVVNVTQTIAQIPGVVAL